MSIKVRFAPSPTGNLHIGSARTALFNWLFAKKNGGQFILRIEDTDLERSKKEYETDIIEGLSWLGISWDGEIYRQTKRLNLYKQYLQTLLDNGKAFWCHHTVEELETESKAQMASKEPPRHICDHKNSQKGKQTGEIIRLAVDRDAPKIIFKDLIRGDIEWDPNLLSDISLAKDLDTPLYNFAVVADDIDMKISQVIRGEDHIANTPKQILIYQALGEKIPEFAHLPLILAPDKSKLSKRHGAVAVTEYKQDYLPDALVNFMGTLGYTYSKEILSKEEMAKEFEISKVHKSGAVFDVKKLNWINTQYMKQLPLEEFNRLTGIQASATTLPIIVERLERLSDVAKFHYFNPDDKPEYSRDLLKWKEYDYPAIESSLRETKQIIEHLSVGDQSVLREAFDALAGKIGDKGLVYWPFRVALTGEKASADPIDIAISLSQEVVIQRIDRALAKITT